MSSPRNVSKKKVVIPNEFERSFPYNISDKNDVVLGLDQVARRRHFKGEFDFRNFIDFAEGFESEHHVDTPIPLQWVPQWANDGADIGKSFAPALKTNFLLINSRKQTAPIYIQKKRPKISDDDIP